MKWGVGVKVLAVLLMVVATMGSVMAVDVLVLKETGVDKTIHDKNREIAVKFYDIDEWWVNEVEKYYKAKYTMGDVIKVLLYNLDADETTTIEVIDASTGDIKVSISFKAASKELYIDTAYLYPGLFYVRVTTTKNDKPVELDSSDPNKCYEGRVFIWIYNEPKLKFLWVPKEIRMVKGDEIDVYVKVNCDPDDVVVKAELEGLGVKVKEDNLIFTKYNESNGVGWVYVTLYPFYNDTLDKLVSKGEPDELLKPGMYTLTIHMYNRETGEEISEAETTIPVIVEEPKLNVDAPSEVKKGEPIVVKIDTNRGEKGYDYLYVVLDLGVKRMKYTRIALDENGDAVVEIPTAGISPGEYKLYVRDAMRTIPDKPDVDIEDWYDIDPTDSYAKYYNAQDDILFVKTVKIVEAGAVIYPEPSYIDLRIEESGKVSIILDEVPETGLSYVNVSIKLLPYVYPLSTDVAEIADIEFPTWTPYVDNSTLPATEVWFKVGDLNNEVKAGDTNVVLANVTIKGLTEGGSDIAIMVNSFQDDNYNEIKDQIDTWSGYIHVGLAKLVISPEKIVLSPNSTAKVKIMVDKIPESGLSYANISVWIPEYLICIDSVCNPSQFVRVIDIEFPSWATLHGNSTLPATEEMWFKVGDLSDQVKGGDENVTLAVLTIEALREGEGYIDAWAESFQDDNYDEKMWDILPAEAWIEVKAGPPPIDGHQPKDLDGDGLYEDVNGDGQFNFGDVIFFFMNFDKDETKNHPEYYDFNNDGSVNFGDVVALFKML